jgi:hypothetical protein
MLGAPSVHDGATSTFVDGLAAEQGLGPIQQVQYVKALRW